MTFLAPKDSPTIKTLSLFDWAISALSAVEIPVIGGMTDSILRIRRERIPAARQHFLLPPQSVLLLP